MAYFFLKLTSYGKAGAGVGSDSCPVDKCLVVCVVGAQTSSHTMIRSFFGPQNTNSPVAVFGLTPKYAKVNSPLAEYPRRSVPISTIGSG